MSPNLVTSSHYLAQALLPLRPNLAMTLLGCTPKWKCNSPYCPSCRQSDARDRSKQLGQRIAQNPNTSLFASLTIQSCEPLLIRDTAKGLIGGWDKLVDNRQTRHATGTYRWLEVTADENQPWLENVHVHGVLAMSPAYSGRNYLSSADWQELWRESIGSAYRSADVTKIRTPGAVAGYVAALDKFIAAAELGAREPERHITRNEQMKGLPRYCGVGSLGDGTPIEGIWAGDGWKRGMRQLDRRINHPGYVPIPIEAVVH